MVVGGGGEKVVYDNWRTLLAAEQKWHFERSTAPAYLNANGSVNVQANRMFQANNAVCTLPAHRQTHCLSATFNSCGRCISSFY